MRNFTRASHLVLAAALLLSLTGGCSKKARSGRHLQQADKYFAAGQYPKAEIEYLNTLRLDYTNARAISRLGAIYYDEGRFARSIPFLAKACQLVTNDVESHFKLGSIYLASGRVKEAREEAVLVLDKMPGHAEAPIMLAESVTTRTNLADVRQRLEDLSAQSGETAPLQMALGVLHLREGDAKAAEACFKRAESLDSKSSAAHSALGSLSWAQNDLKSADAELKTAAELSPPRSVRRLSYADFKIKTGDLEAGKGLLGQITRETPDFLPAWL